MTEVGYQPPHTLTSVTSISATKPTLEGKNIKRKQMCQHLSRICQRDPGSAKSIENLPTSLESANGVDNLILTPSESAKPTMATAPCAMSTTSTVGPPP
jgi:hypothetical protein